MSAYGSGSGPEYLDEPPEMPGSRRHGDYGHDCWEGCEIWKSEPPEDVDGWTQALPYHVTWANGSTSHAHYEDASRFAETFVERGVAVAVSCGDEYLWSYEPSRTNESGEGN